MMIPTDSLKLRTSVGRFVCSTKKNLDIVSFPCIIYTHFPLKMGVIPSPTPPVWVRELQLSKITMLIVLMADSLGMIH